MLIDHMALQIEAEYAGNDLKVEANGNFIFIYEEFLTMPFLTVEITNYY